MRTTRKGMKIKYLIARREGSDIAFFKKIYDVRLGKEITIWHETEAILFGTVKEAQALIEKFELDYATVLAIHTYQEGEEDNDSKN